MGSCSRCLDVLVTDILAGLDRELRITAASQTWHMETVRAIWALIYHRRLLITLVTFCLRRNNPDSVTPHHPLTSTGMNSFYCILLFLQQKWIFKIFNMPTFDVDISSLNCKVPLCPVGEPTSDWTETEEASSRSTDIQFVAVSRPEDW